MSDAGRIERLDPPAAIPGGEMLIHCAGFGVEGYRLHRCAFNEMPARMVASSPLRVLAHVPVDAGGGKTVISLDHGNGANASAACVIGQRLAGDLHPVANPAFDPDDGSLFVTRSGTRGQHLPVTLFRIDAAGDVTEFSGDIQNPTGIAFDGTGRMHVTNRADGVVFRIDQFRDATTFATDLGTATGLAFGPDGMLYVGDRTGTIFRIEGRGEVAAWAEIEPSVSAFHLAFGPDGCLYVTGPTVSSNESVLRIDPLGEVNVFFRGLGRPQGLAFDRDGNLYVAASYKGRRGIVRIDVEGTQAEMAVAGMNVVGLAFSRQGEMAVTTNEAVYLIEMGIYGTLLG